MGRGSRPCTRCRFDLNRSSCYPRLFRLTAFLPLAFFFAAGFVAASLSTISPDTGSVTPTPPPRSSRSSRNVSRRPIICGRAAARFSKRAHSPTMQKVCSPASGDRKAMLHRLKSFFTSPESKSSRTARLIALESGGRARWTPRDYAALARQGYARNAIVYRAVRLIAESVGSLYFVLYEGE